MHNPAPHLTRLATLFPNWKRRRVSDCASVARRHSPHVRPEAAPADRPPRPRGCVARVDDVAARRRAGVVLRIPRRRTPGEPSGQGGAPRFEYAPMGGVGRCSSFLRRRPPVTHHTTSSPPRAFQGSKAAKVFARGGEGADDIHAVFGTPRTCIGASSVHPHHAHHAFLRGALP